MLLNMFAQKLAALSVLVLKRKLFLKGFQDFIVKASATPHEQVINMYGYQPLKLPGATTVFVINAWIEFTLLQMT